ncbi:hypothetical protein J2T08_005483 [Neorhizobium galegae]|nr:hypothetical protein [Neorhizobium galegae]
MMPDVGYCGDTAMGQQARAGLPNNYVDRSRPEWMFGL